jgi:transcriptional regulator with XRE-family HTH domain
MIMTIVFKWLNVMSIASRLATIRKQKGLTQQALADAIGLCVTQVKRYESGTSLPSLEAIKKIAKTLRVTTDWLIFDEEELAPNTDLALQFQAISHMPESQQAIIKQLLEGMIIKYEAERWSSKLKASQ